MVYSCTISNPCPSTSATMMWWNAILSLSAMPNHTAHSRKNAEAKLKPNEQDWSHEESLNCRCRCDIELDQRQILHRGKTATGFAPQWVLFRHLSPNWYGSCSSVQILTCYTRNKWISQCVLFRTNIHRPTYRPWDNFQATELNSKPVEAQLEDVWLGWESHNRSTSLERPILVERCWQS